MPCAPSSSSCISYPLLAKVSCEGIATSGKHLISIIPKNGTYAYPFIIIVIIVIIIFYDYSGAFIFSFMRLLVVSSIWLALWSADKDPSRSKVGMYTIVLHTYRHQPLLCLIQIYMNYRFK